MEPSKLSDSSLIAVILPLRMELLAVHCIWYRPSRGKKCSTSSFAWRLNRVMDRLHTSGCLSSCDVVTRCIFVTVGALPKRFAPSPMLHWLGWYFSVVGHQANPSQRRCCWSGIKRAKGRRKEDNEGLGEWNEKMGNNRPQGKLEHGIGMKWEWPQRELGITLAYHSFLNADFPLDRHCLDCRGCRRIKF